MKKVVLALAVLGVAVVLVWWLRGDDDAGTVRTATASKPGTTARAAATARPPAKPASVGGKVTRSADGAAVAGAVVALARAELGEDFGTVGAPTIVATTDDSGAWRAPQVPPGDYVVTAAARGLLPSAGERMTLQSGEQRTLDFTLAAGGTAVRGTVSDVGGGPIANARITAKRTEVRLAANPELVALTGDDGTYELTLPDGDYRLRADHDDYTAQSEEAQVEGKPLVIDFTLVPGALIRGQVVARDTREPVAGALVRASLQGARGEGARDVVAEADGSFVLRGLAAGAVEISARARGYATASPAVVQVGIGEHVEDVQVFVDRAYSISGRVVKTGTQDGIAGARVGAFSMKGGQGDALEPTDASGAFEIVGLRAGSYILYAAAENTTLEIGKSVTIVDRDVTDVVIELGTGVTLSGRVEPPHVAQIALELEGEIGLGNMFEMAKTMLVRAESDATGAFALRHVPPGKFKLVASTKEGSVGKLPVVVAATDQTGLVVTLEKRASIAGRVIDTNGKPAPGVTVRASPTDRRGMTMSSIMLDRGHRKSGPDGSFNIVGLEPGKYVLRTTETIMDMTFSRTNDKQPDVTVELAAGAEKTGVTLTVAARDGVIRGTVLGADGKPAADAWVTTHLQGDIPDGMPASVAAYLPASSREPVLSDDGGRFVIDRLHPGTYTVIAEGPRGSSRGEVKSVKTGTSTTVKLAALGKLVVTVTERGTPVKTYDVECTSQRRDIERHAVTDDGSYALENLPPAEYTCQIDAATGTGEGKVTVPSGEAKLAVALSAFGSLTGVVVNVLTNKPVPGLSIIADTRDGSGFIAAMAGQGVKTDGSGRFVVERVRAGKGQLMILGRDHAISSMASHEYTAKEGERTDLGTIKIAPPRTTEAGTFGLATEIDGDALKVTSVDAGKPAAQAGIVVGDRIVAVEGQAVKTVGADLARKLLSSGTVGIGETYRLGLERGPTVTITSVKW